MGKTRRIIRYGPDIKRIANLECDKAALIEAVNLARLAP